MSKDTFYNLVSIIILCSVLATLIYGLFPRLFKVKGQVTDWIGNDNGFGIKIDHITYWFTYPETFNSPVEMQGIVGYNCEVLYLGTYFNPCGIVNIYAVCINLTITP